MSYVAINAITVPESAGEELEKRFAQRAGSVDKSPGFIRFKLLRPESGEKRYFVYTEWNTKEDFENWLATRADHAHSQEQKKPVATGADLMQFSVALESSAQ